MRRIQSIFVMCVLGLMVAGVSLRHAPAIGQTNEPPFQLYVPNLTQSPAADLQAFAASVPTADVIVVLRSGNDNPGATARELARRHGGQVGFVYSHALRGFSLSLPAPAVAALSRDARVAHVELDQVVELYAQNIPTGISRIFAVDDGKIGNGAIGIDGIDDRVDVDVAVIDTGLDASHPDLNVYRIVNCSGGNPFRPPTCTEGQGSDGNGHGTHVGGTIGALDNNEGVVGVAPGARLWGIKVLDNNGSGYMSWIVAGIDYVTAHSDKIEVANMSLGCQCTSVALDEAIASSVAAGVVYAVAAGNDSQDAASFSPANHKDVITVSALADFDGLPGEHGSPTCRDDEDDTLANFSNYGSLVEIAAPGVCILSTWPGGGYNTISGTSMASPHVAGAAALLASMPTNQSEDVDIRAILVDAGNFDWTDDSGDPIKDKEPLLDVRDATVFNPEFVVIGDDGGGNPDDPDDPTDPSDPPPGGFTLSASGYKDKGLQKAELSWSGASTDVDILYIYRNGSLLIDDGTANDGAYLDEINARGGGSYTYQICETKTKDICSNEATVNF